MSVQTETATSPVMAILNQSWCRQAMRFVPIGIGAVAIDFIIYFSVLFVGFGIGPAKAIGFLSGSLLSYWGNRRFTFQRGGKSLNHIAVFLIIYLVSMGANVAINSSIAMLSAGSSIMLIIAFFGATLFSAAFNFLGLKYLVFMGENLKNK